MDDEEAEKAYNRFRQENPMPPNARDLLDQFAAWQKRNVTRNQERVITGQWAKEITYEETIREEERERERGREIEHERLSRIADIMRAEREERERIERGISPPPPVEVREEVIVYISDQPEGRVLWG
jgi:hypothetical protein